MFRFAFSIRLGFMNKVWEKAIRLSSAGKQDPSMGNIQTLMAVDPMRIFGGAVGVHWIWLGPVLICAAVGLMAIEIGPVALVPVVVLLIIVFIQIKIVLRIKRTRRNVVQHTDRRVQLTNEILTGIRMIKAYAWEEHATIMVEEARSKELHHLKWLLYYLAANAIVFFMAPILIAVCTFSTYAAVYGSDKLNVPKVVAVLGYMNLMRLPMALTPKMLGAFVDSLVSYNRLGKFLFQSDEIAKRPMFPRTKEDDEIVVHIPKNSSFSWAMEVPSKRSTRVLPNQTNSKNRGLTKNEEVVAESAEGQKSLRTETEEMFGEKSSNGSSTGAAAEWSLNVVESALNLRKGSLTVVVGTVGSGKSSLFSAILHEMKNTSNNGSVGSGVVVRGSVALVAQKAWIQNATVKDAILFGSKYDEKQYNTVLQHSQLKPDLVTLPHGDKTEIGDRGLNLSGGQKQRIAIARSLYKQQEKDLFLFDDPLSAVDVHVASALWKEALGKGSVLEGKTRVVVMNSHYHFLQQADHVIYLDNGTVTYYENPQTAVQDHPWLQSKTISTTIDNGDVQEDGGDGDRAQQSRAIHLQVAEEAEVDDTTSSMIRHRSVSHQSVQSVESHQSSARTRSLSSNNNKLYEKENRVKGAVTLATYVTWFRSAASCGGGVPLAVTVFIFFAFVQVSWLEKLEQSAHKLKRMFSLLYRCVFFFPPRIVY